MQALELLQCVRLCGMFVPMVAMLLEYTTISLTTGREWNTSIAVLSLISVF